MKWLLLLIPLISFAVFDSLPHSQVRSIATSTSELNTASTSESTLAVSSTPKPAITIEPKSIIQGDPALIEVTDLGTSTVRSIKFNNSDLPFFTHEDGVKSLVGIDLRFQSGSYPVVVTLSNGTTVKKNLVVGERIIAKAPLGIPESLGGNTKQSEQTLVSTLLKEAAIMNAVTSTSTKLWSEKFRMPLNGEIVITDVYGYSRITGGSSLSHKGTDFRAATGTPVYSVNRGVVAYTGYLRNYGNVIIVDHGMGLQSVYMHLSEINVKNGEIVDKGELIGRSGATGYVLGPHLHLSIRINHISIDPMKFFEIMS